MGGRQKRLGQLTVIPEGGGGGGGGGQHPFQAQACDQGRPRRQQSQESAPPSSRGLDAGGGARRGPAARTPGPLARVVPSRRGYHRECAGGGGCPRLYADPPDTRRCRPFKGGPRSATFGAVGLGVFCFGGSTKPTTFLCFGAGDGLSGLWIAALPPTFPMAYPLEGVIGAHGRCRPGPPPLKVKQNKTPAPPVLIFPFFWSHFFVW